MSYPSILCCALFLSCHKKSSWNPHTQCPVFQQKWTLTCIFCICNLNLLCWCGYFKLIDWIYSIQTYNKFLSLDLYQCHYFWVFLVWLSWHHLLIWMLLIDFDANASMCFSFHCWFWEALLQCVLEPHLLGACMIS
jgi:hypothetical protein